MTERKDGYVGSNCSAGRFGGLATDKQRMAVSRQNQATRDALKRQRDYQMRAEKIVMDNADVPAGYA